MFIERKLKMGNGRMDATRPFGVNNRNRRIGSLLGLERITNLNEIVNW